MRRRENGTELAGEETALRADQADGDEDRTARCEIGAAEREENAGSRG